MCGICGIINLDNLPVSELNLSIMMDLQKHRGPDDTGFFIENNIGFGFVRLSIIDLSPLGHQPMFSIDDRYVIVFNGEIYNYLELREELIKAGYVFRTNTDTEVLINAFIEWGEDCLAHFNGMWAFVIYDRIKKSIFASRDRFGIKPFYYLRTENIFAFASEIPPLLSLLKTKPIPDYQSIFEFLAFNRTDQNEQTFFKDLKKLQHGNKLSIISRRAESEGISYKISINQWYNLRERLLSTKRFNDADEFRKLFSSAVGWHMRSDVPVGVCLSGGLDSSSIVSTLLKDFNKQDLNTFSAVYDKGQIGDESDYINLYKPYLQNMYFTTPTSETLENDLYRFVKIHAEPIPSTSPYAQFKVMELAKGKVIVTLDGQGADEELGGYHYFFGFYFKDLFLNLKFWKLFKEIFWYLFKHRSLLGIKSFLFFILPLKLKTKVRVKEKDYLNNQFVNEYSKQSNIAANIYSSKTLNEALLNHFEFKLEHLLKWEDRNSMFFSLEARVPFLDYRLVEKLLVSPGEMIIHNGMTKHILREGMKETLPEKIRLRRDKIGFDTPQDEWFKKPGWEELIINLLNSDSFRRRNLINPEKAILQYKKHLKGKINISKEIWKWVHLELWFREFID